VFKLSPEHALLNLWYDRANRKPNPEPVPNKLRHGQCLENIMHAEQKSLLKLAAKL
jgi:hypothetical protein